MKGDSTKLADLVTRTKGTVAGPREVIQSLKVLAPEAVNTLKDLMANSTDSVKLKAAMHILALTGYQVENILRVQTDVKDLDSGELDSRLRDLLGDAAQTVIEGDFTSVNEVTPLAVEANTH
jgi:hypothetical protein